MSRQNHSIPPIYDKDSKVLILGSFPSVLSRENHFYYANPTNRFWPVMEQIYEETILDREAFCHKHHIALWDTIKSCEVEGSLDTSIREIECNPIDQFVSDLPIQCIFTTGSFAAKVYIKYIHTSLMHIALPSTSSANARMKLNDLVNYYKQIREYTDA